MFLISCSKNFSTPKYRKKFSKEWKRKRIIIFKQGTYKDPNIKSEYRKSIIFSRSINLDKF